MEAETLAVAHEIDFSFFGLFARATLIVKIVMIMLIAASFWAWSVIVIKLILYRKTQREAAAFDRAFWSGEPLDGLFADIGPAPSGGAEKIFAAGMVEWQRSHHDDGGLIAGATQRIDRSMDVAIQKETEALQSGLTILATVGSTAPFVGLFGTVWGIMNAFIEIGQSQSTSLAVVAPGIAEALLATGLGLLAAIPAVIFFNKLSSDADRIVGGYEAFADEFATILSRQLDAA
jgi:biopolymer transport protein TolQ